MNTLDHIDFNKIIDYLQSMANSALAKKNLAEIQAKSSPEEAYQSFAEIDNAMEHLKQHGNRPRFDSIDEFQAVLKRLEKNAKLDPQELIRTRSYFHELSSLARQLTDLDTQWSRDYTSQFLDPRPVITYIDQLIGSEGEIRTDASELLYKCFHEKKDLKNGIHTLLDRLVKQHDLSTVLQDKFVTTREGRWVLPIKKDMQGKFDGIIHDTSHSKQTVFMEPQEVVKSNNRIKELENTIAREIDRLLREISDYLYKLYNDINDSFAHLVYLDGLFSKACLKRASRGSAIQFSQNELDLIDFSNPVLEIQKTADDKIVRNHLKLEEGKKLLILSGPNAGGKTILLKSLGLAAHLARCGLCVSAQEESKLPFFKEIFISVGDAQNITEGLSTFAGHMKELNEAADLASSDTLILVDEICGSTDPDEGSALAKAFIDKYSENSAYSLITSHLSSLKQNWRDDDSITHASMEFDEVNGKPIYKLLLGVSGSSYAWKTAKRIGVNEDILESALNYLSPEVKNRQNKLEDIEETREQLLKAQKQLDFEIKQSVDQKNKYKSLIERFKVEKDKKLDKSIKAAEARIDEELLKARKTKSKSAFDLKAELPSIVKKKEETSILTKEDFNKAFPPGTQVFATNIQRNAITQSAANSKGEVEILSNSMKILVPWKFLKVRDQKEPRFKKNNFSLHRKTEDAKQDNNSSLDLRGRNVEDSLCAIDEFCDHALLAGTDKVKIIHGHGTQVLKKAVRIHLAKANYSERWQSGGKHDGGDGVTWVYLK